MANQKSLLYFIVPSLRIFLLKFKLPYKHDKKISAHNEPVVVVEVAAAVMPAVVFANLSLFLTYIERCTRTMMFINSFLFVL